MAPPSESPFLPLALRDEHHARCHEQKAGPETPGIPVLVSPELGYVDHRETCWILGAWQCLVGVTALTGCSRGFYSCLELEVFPSPGLCLGRQCVQVYGFFSFPVL